MKKYFVTILCLFFSAVLYSGESENKNPVLKDVLDTDYSDISSTLDLDLKTGPRETKKLSGPEINDFENLKGKYKLTFKYDKKYQDSEHPFILRYRIDPRVDEDMPRMSPDPEVDAKILKVYPHIGVGLLGEKKCPHPNPHNFFKK